MIIEIFKTPWSKILRFTRFLSGEFQYLTKHIGGKDLTIIWTDKPILGNDAIPNQHLKPYINYFYCFHQACFVFILHKYFLLFLASVLHIYFACSTPPRGIPYCIRISLLSCVFLTFCYVLYSYIFLKVVLYQSCTL